MHIDAICQRDFQITDHSTEAHKFFRKLIQDFLKIASQKPLNRNSRISIETLPNSKPVVNDFLPEGLIVWEAL